jgi:hypothetical protein
MIDLVIIFLWPMLYFVYYGNKLIVKPTSKTEVGRWVLYLLAAIVLLVPAFIGFLADVVMNNTTVPFALKGGWFEEFTFSTRLERLCVKDDSELVTRRLCIEIGLAINRVCPTKDHIQAVLDPTVLA